MQEIRTYLKAADYFLSSWHTESEESMIPIFSYLFENKDPSSVTIGHSKQILSEKFTDRVCEYHQGIIKDVERIQSLRDQVLRAYAELSWIEFSLISQPLPYTEAPDLSGFPLNEGIKEWLNDIIDTYIEISVFKREMYDIIFTEDMKLIHQLLDVLEKSKKQVTSDIDYFEQCLNEARDAIKLRPNSGSSELNEARDHFTTQISTRAQLEDYKID